jgi:hypothetical protein
VKERVLRIPYAPTWAQQEKREREMETRNVCTFIHLLLVPHNCSRGRGVIPSLAGGAVCSAYVSVGTASLDCSVLRTAVAVSSPPGLRRQCFPLRE